MFSTESSLASIDATVFNTKMFSIQECFQYKNALKIQKCFGYTKNTLDIQNSSDYKMTYK